MGHEPDFFSAARRQKLRRDRIEIYALGAFIVLSPLLFLALSAGLHWVTH